MLCYVFNMGNLKIISIFILIFWVLYQWTRIIVISPSFSIELFSYFSYSNVINDFLIILYLLVTIFIVLCWIYLTLWILISVFGNGKFMWILGIIKYTFSVFHFREIKYFLIFSIIPILLFLYQSYIKDDTFLKYMFLLLCMLHLEFLFFIHSYLYNKWKFSIKYFISFFLFCFYTVYMLVWIYGPSSFWCYQGINFYDNNCLEIKYKNDKYAFAWSWKIIPLSEFEVFYSASEYNRLKDLQQ